MRNAAPRRPHRERAQPAGREKWGLLEKHKDYSLRAKDYNTKKRKLGELERKVREKHPDEFAYGMMSKKQGKHGKGGSQSLLSHDAVKLLKSQDAGYLRVALGRGSKEMRKMEEEVGLDAAGKATARKVVFHEEEQPEKRGKKRTSGGKASADIDVNEAFAVENPAEGNLDIEAMDVTEKTPPTTKSKSPKALAAEKDAAARLKAERKKRRRLQEMRVAKLELLKKRQKDIMAAADQLELQRAKMARTVGGVNKNGVKFKIRERKR